MLRFHLTALIRQCSLWMVIDFILSWTCYTFALFVRGVSTDLHYTPSLQFAVLASIIVVVCNRAICSYRWWWRFTTSQHFVPLATSVTAATVAVSVVNLAWPGFRPMPLSVVFLGGFFALLAMTVVRYRSMLSVAAEHARRRVAEPPTNRLLRILVVRVGGTRLLLAASVVVGVSVIISPVFRQYAPSYATTEFTAHVAIVAAALDTWQVTQALPISSSEIHPGVEYPYILFGNTAFYVLSALVSGVLGVPPYLGAAVTLAAGFAAATFAVFLLATSAGLNRYLSVALGFLYASGPYLCVNLYVRNAFPEYLTWQTVPMLFLAARSSLQPQGGPMGMLAGALALAAPFYLHKLVAPHIALTLAILAVNTVPWRVSTLSRLALVSTLAILFSVPAWYPSLRSLGGETVRILGGDAVPGIFHTTLTNLFWPYARNSLPSGPAFEFYEGRFALQAGLVSLTGFVAAVGMMLTQPRLAWERRLPLLLVLFIVNVLFVMGWFRIWEFAPSPLRYVQFSYRLIGLVHFLGFILFVQALGSPQQLLRRTPLWLQQLGAMVFVVLAVLGVSTYWHNPPPSALASATIRPGDLDALDPCAFCRPTPRSTLVTQAAIARDRSLVVPPMPIPVPVDAGLQTLILSGDVPPLLFERTSEDLVVRIYGFVKVEPAAQLNSLISVIVGTASGNLRSRPWRHCPKQPDGLRSETMRLRSEAGPYKCPISRGPCDLWPRYPSRVPSFPHADVVGRVHLRDRDRMQPRCLAPPGQCIGGGHQDALPQR